MVSNLSDLHPSFLLVPPQVGVGVGIEEKKKPALVGGELAGKKVVAMRPGGMHTIAVTEQGEVRRLFTLYPIISCKRPFL